MTDSLTPSPYHLRAMVPEAELQQTDAGLVPASPGWFVMNARDARWFEKPGQGFSLPLTGDDEYEAETFFPMLGMAIRVVSPRGADRHVPLGDRAGGLARPFGRGTAHCRGSGAPTEAVGLRALPAGDAARVRRRGRRALRAPVRELAAVPEGRPVGLLLRRY